MTDQLTKFADNILDSVKGYIQRSFASVMPRIEALEKRAPEVGPAGKDGKDGSDADSTLIAKDVLNQVLESLDSIAPPKDGKDGERGADGKDGAPGGVGPQGERGVDGKDGAPGELGLKGEDGRDGKDGAPGERGIKGDPGLDGKDGVPGERGQKGDDGLDGREGEPGRDAIQIEVLDGIDTAKKYQRGTYAHYRGGIVRSFRATDPLGESLEKSGWHVVVEGIADTQVDMTQRTVTIRTMKTSGGVVEKSFAVPVMLYQGIWTERSYAIGDVTTWDGSMWHCEKATTDKPGSSEEWKLCVKHGRAGRDGLRGEKGERGAEGRAGKDLTQMGFDGAKY